MNTGCNSCNSCNTCNTCPSTNPCTTPCKSQITAADLGELIYIAGLDVNLCPKYTTIIDALGLVDCNGDPITAATPIVTCSEFLTEFCALLTALTTGAPVAVGTVLIGADCAKHVMPAFQAPLTVVDSSCIDLTLTGGTALSASPIISPTAGNIVVCNGNGLYASICTGIANLGTGSVVTMGMPLVGGDCALHIMPPFQSPIIVADTNCINLTFVGEVLSADPIISPTVGNQLTCSANGLLVPAVIVPAETGITVVDTNCINLTASGVNNHTLQADVIVSPTVGNASVCTSNGLYTPDLCTQMGDVGGIVLPAIVGDIFITNNCIPRTLPSNGGVTVLDTVTINETLVGNVLSSDVNVSSVPDNILTIRPDGLAVRCTDVLSCIPDTSTSIVVTDTSCLNLTVTEAPANTFNLTGNPIVAPTAGNQLSCTATGLFVQATPVDIGTTYPGALAGCNGLVNTANGLAAPPNSTGNRAAIVSAGGLFNGHIIENTVIVSAVYTVNIVNPSNCRSAVLELVATIPQIHTANLDAGQFLISVEVYESFNLPAILITPFALRSLSQIHDGDATAGAGRAGADYPEIALLSQFTVPPSFVGSYSVYAQISQTDGSGDAYVSTPGISYTLFTI